MSARLQQEETELENLNILNDSITFLDNSYFSLSKGIESLDQVIYKSLNQPSYASEDEFRRLARIIKMKKVFRIYPISYINEQVNDYNNIKNNRILGLIATLEKLNGVKLTEKENLINRIDVAQHRLQQVVDHKNLESRNSIRSSLATGRGHFEEEKGVGQSNAADNGQGREEEPQEDLPYLTEEEQQEIEQIQQEISRCKFQISKLQMSRLQQSKISRF